MSTPAVCATTACLFKEQFDVKVEQRIQEGVVEQPVAVTVSPVREVIVLPIKEEIADAVQQP